MELERLRKIHKDMLQPKAGGGDSLDCADISSALGAYIEECEDAEKKEKNDLAELALNYWRLSNWLNNSNADRKAVANSALKKINAYLEKQQIALMDLTGQKYDDGYAADVMGIESDRDVSEDELIVSEMVKPIIMYQGSVVRYGQVVLGDEIKSNRPEEELTLPDDPEKGIPMIQRDIDGYCASKYKEKSIARKLRWCRVKLDKWLRNWRRSK